MFSLAGRMYLVWARFNLFHCVFCEVWAELLNVIQKELELRWVEGLRRLWGEESGGIRSGPVPERQDGPQLRQMWMSFCVITRRLCVFVSVTAHAEGSRAGKMPSVDRKYWFVRGALHCTTVRVTHFLHEAEIGYWWVELSDRSLLPSYNRHREAPDQCLLNSFVSLEDL
jgi:hypothetical protein